MTKEITPGLAVVAPDGRDFYGIDYSGARDLVPGYISPTLEIRVSDLEARKLDVSEFQTEGNDNIRVQIHVHDDNVEFRLPQENALNPAPDSPSLFVPYSVFDTGLRAIAEYQPRATQNGQLVPVERTLVMLRNRGQREEVTASRRSIRAASRAAR